MELMRGLKVLHRDVRHGFAGVLLLVPVVPRHENLVFAVGSWRHPGSGYRCTEHLQQINCSGACVYSEGIIELSKQAILVALPEHPQKLWVSVKTEPKGPGLQWDAVGTQPNVEA